MAETQPVQPVADRSAMHRHAVHLLQLQAQLVQRQLALLGQPGAPPAAQAAQFAMSAAIALGLRVERPGIAPELDHIVDEFRRNPEMLRRRAVRIPLVDKRNNPLAQLKWMWFPHLQLPYLPPAEGITNQPPRESRT